MNNNEGKGTIVITLVAIMIALIFAAINPAPVVALPGGITEDGTVNSCEWAPENSHCSLRIYGTFGEGPGNLTVTDPETGLRPENPPYTDPVGPFHPQNEQAPRKDFVTFNPAIMDHNQGYPELDFIECGVHSVQRPQEKVFKRMWYEKEWFKDHDRDGCWDVVIDKYNPSTGKYEYDRTMCLKDWNIIPEWIKVKAGLRIREWNNDPTINDSNVDIYGPAIKQEFAYMFLDDERMPIMIGNGSDVLIPMAHDPANPYRGLNSFDADGDGVRDAVRVESEATLGLDIDHDGIIEPMDSDGIELSGDETVVLVLGDKYLNQNDTIQFFDHVVTLKDVQELGAVGRALFDVCDNEGGGPQRCKEDVMLQLGQVAYFYRAKHGSPAERETFYLRLLSADAVSKAAVIEVGRMFGQTYANIGANPYWSQKAFIVDEVFYNVVAIKAQDNCIKYIVFREKLPKRAIELYGKDLKVWEPGEILPELPPFNMNHEVIVDVQDTWTWSHSQQDKIGPKISHPPPPPICVVYGIDSAACMHKNDPDDLRKKLAKNFTRELDPDKDAAGVVCWSDKIDNFWPLDNDFGKVKSEIGRCQNGGRHRDIDRALNKCIDLVLNCTNDDATRVILFMSGGKGIYTTCSNHGPAYRAKINGIKIYSIGINDQAEEDLNDTASCTNGKYYRLSSPIDVPGIINDILKDIGGGGGESHGRALKITYLEEGEEERFIGEMKEIYDETHNDLHELFCLEDEFWMLEWFHTLPQQYTAFRLPAGDKHLVTLSWVANESEITLWDSDPDGPAATYTGERFKFWYEDCSGPLYINASQSSIRLYGTFDEGPGDLTVTDPETGLRPENPPYTDPVGPFHPQHPQAPRKDFMTFNPAIMDHNQGYPELDFVECGVHSVQRPQEKVFKRMWYEKEWFKDHDRDGCWDVVIDKYNPSTGKYEYDRTMCLKDWNIIPEWIKVKAGLRIREWNNDPTINDSNVDIYGPAIKQEFAYMFLDDERMPIMIGNGSDVLIPMAHDPANPYRGLNSFDADGDGVRDAVRVESEATLGLDIDHDGMITPMGGVGIGLSGDETVVLVLGDKYIAQGGTIQFFDHVVTLKDVQELGAVGRALFDVCDNEGGGSQRCKENVMLRLGQVAFFYRAKPGSPAERETFYLRLLSADAGSKTAVIEVGRMFGQTYANIGANPYWSQKAFIVDEVFYNVVAIKAQDNCIKYIVFREKLPKLPMPIKLYGKHLKIWAPGETLPEMSPFNMPHDIIVDVQNSSSWTMPHSQQDKIGPKQERGALKITYVEEGEEERFKGELKEIYNETCEHEEFWNVEWFHTQPQQYTAFVMPEDQLYLMTLAWYAPESCITIWNHEPSIPAAYYTGERVKFWYDPANNTDIYVNRV